MYQRIERLFAHPCFFSFHGSYSAISSAGRLLPIVVFSQPGAEYVVENADAETASLFPPIDEAWIYGYAEEMRHFIDCVANNRTPRETFEDGYVVNCVLDAAYRSMQTKQWEKVSY
jgi:predicted dehydrogenase